ncbi:MAG: TusE/DsrC/DsvC family sulfur relay protein [Bacteroidales bacterium]|nr:TusE/DsrC/DsvC family sulfur relay protein [Bacteroidales bacterium]MBN2758457.1 TusE/DsrC/DsvC family sulfur relay protein [Bacteroidales bacterium]
MAQKNYSGVNISVDEEGYMTDSSQWTKEIAKEMAKEEGLNLTEEHIKLLEFIREKVLSGSALTIRAIGKSGFTDIKGFYQLFPGAPLKKATKYAGVSKPSTCV